MREFKFRAWNKQNNEMVDLVTVGSREVDKNRSTWPALYYRKSDGIITGFDHEDYEVLQYTGLKDVRGIDIYEGDILKLNLDSFADGEEPTIFPINDYTFDLSYITQINQFIEKHEDEEDVHDFIEVIGNIYENPELLVGDEHGQTS